MRLQVYSRHRAGTALGTPEGAPSGLSLSWERGGEGRSEGPDERAPRGSTHPPALSGCALMWGLRPHTPHGPTPAAPPSRAHPKARGRIRSPRPWRDLCRTVIPARPSHHPAPSRHSGPFPSFRRKPESRRAGPPARPESPDGATTLRRGALTLTLSLGERGPEPLPVIPAKAGIQARRTTRATPRAPMARRHSGEAPSPSPLGERGPEPLLRHSGAPSPSFRRKPESRRAHPPPSPRGGRWRNVARRRLGLTLSLAEKGPEGGARGEGAASRCCGCAGRGRSGGRRRRG